MKKKMILGLLIIIIIVLGIGNYFIFNNKENKNSDSLRFKTEYELLNNTIRESDGALYNDVDIDEKNPIKYVNIDDATTLLESKKAIIYVGANWCPWCRNMLSAMFDVAKELNIDTIYYLELDDDKSNYEIKDGELKKINNGSESYYKLLEKLKDYLRDYELKDNDKTYSTGEKRIYMPFFITVKNGSIIEAKVISRTLGEGQTKYSEITKDQYKDLYNNFYETFKKVYSPPDTCDIDTECN